MSKHDSQLPEEGPSKSQRKRDMQALQKIGETLVGLPDVQLDKIPLSGRLLDAVMEARSLKSFEAKRRQMQYIGKLMRDVDPTPIEEALTKIQFKHQQNKAQFHKIERWRDGLIAEGDKLLEEFLNQYPQTDRQQLRQLIRNAQQKKSGADTELFRYLRAIIE
ncbi:MAG: ribosome biogenesis factor YjgA [Gammaproteobacteria bacterium]